MTSLSRFALAILVLVPGCLPIDLDINKKGELLIAREEGFFLHDWRNGKTTRLPWNGQGLPVHARFLANDSDVLLASSGKQDFGKQTQFEIMPINAGEPRLIYKTSKSVSSASLSPDGKRLVVVQHADLFQDYLPEIFVVEVANGKATLLAENAGPFVRWLPDSSSLFTIKISEKVKDTQHFLGQLGIMNATDGTFTPAAKLLGDRRGFVAIAPDGKRVLFSAFAAGGVDANLDSKKTWEREIFEFHVNSKTIRKITGLDRKIEFARYSPTGKKVLLVAEPKDVLLTERREILIADADLQNPKAIAKNSHSSLVQLSGADINLPGWLDDDSVYYFAKVNVYGTTGHALHLRFVNVDGSNNRDVQPQIDLAIDAGHR